MLWRADPTIGHLRRCACVLLVMVLGACSSMQSDDPPLAEHNLPRYVAPSVKKVPQVALVLSGGSARGFAHLGVLRVLEREGLRPVRPSRRI